MLLFQMVEVVVVRSTVEHLLYPVAGVEPVRIVLQMYNNINTPEKYVNTTPNKHIVEDLLKNSYIKEIDPPRQLINAYKYDY